MVAAGGRQVSPTYVDVIMTRPGYTLTVKVRRFGARAVDRIESHMHDAARVPGQRVWLHIDGIAHEPHVGLALLRGNHGIE